MTQEPNQKTALITGAPKKLGAAIAIEFARRGARVVINYLHSASEAETLVRQLRDMGADCAAFQGDVSDEATAQKLIESTLQAYSSLDILVNNVGPWTDTSLLKLTAHDWNWIMNTNVRATWALTQLAVPHMKARGWGRVINIAAGSAFLRNHSIYGLAKNALLVLTEMLALEVGPNITVNAVAPGLIDDPAVQESIKTPFIGDTPLERLVTFDEVAQMTALLCTPAFDMVTGQCIRMDGGQSIPRDRALESGS